MNKTYQSVIDIPSSYYLEYKEDEGYLSVFIPEQGDNFVRNPTMVDLDNDNFPDGYLTNAVSVLKQNSGPFWNTYYQVQFALNNFFRYVINNQVLSGSFTFSVWLRSTASPTASISLFLSYDDAVTSMTDTKVKVINSIGNEWTQYSVTVKRPENATSDNFTLTLLCQSQAGYVDIGAYQLENKGYPTSFIHGYGGANSKWLGAPFDSASRRYDSDICSGRLVNLKTLGMRLVEFNGGGIPSLDHVSRPLAFEYGSLFDCIALETREYDMTFMLHSCSLKDLMCKRNAIGQAIFDFRQERCFVWQATNCNLPVGKPVAFTAVLNDGFSFGLNSHYGEEIKLSLTGYDVLAHALLPKTCTLELDDEVEHLALLGIDFNGAPVLLPDFTAVGVNVRGIEDAIVSPYDSNLYISAVVGPFGGPYHNEILRYDGSIWYRVATVTTNNAISALGASGKYLWVGMRQQAQLGGVIGYTGTSGNGVARINLATSTVEDIGDISPLLTIAPTGGLTVTPRINQFAFDDNGNTFIGGAFAGFTDGLTSATRWHLGVYRANGQWANTDLNITNHRGNIHSILYDRDTRRLYVGGDFHTLNFYDGNPHIFGYVQFNSPIDLFGTTVVTDWVMRDPGNFAPANYGTVHTIAKYGNRIFVGGRFDLSFGDNLFYMNNFAWYNENSQTPEPVRGEFISPSEWGVSRDGVVITDYPVNNLNVCNNVMILAGPFEQYGQHNPIYRTFIPNSFDPVFITCGSVQYVSTSVNAEVGTMTPTGIEINNVGPLVERCNLNKTLCGSEKLGVSVFYLEKMQNFNDPVTTSSITIPTNCEVCSGEMPVSPMFYLRGGMYLKQITNHTLNVNLFFDYRIAVGEDILIDLSAVVPKFTSSLYGDVTGAFQPMSAPNSFKLFPGDNFISIQVEKQSLTPDAQASVTYYPSAFDIATLNCSDC